MSRAAVILVGVVIVGALAACVAHDDRTDKSDNSDKSGAPTSRLVATVDVVAADRDVVVTAWGSVAPDAQSSRAITSAVEGTVVRALVRAGATVKAGAALVELRPSAQGHLDAERARIDVAFAEAELQRRTALLEKRLLTNSDVAAAAADLEKARAEARAYRAVDGGSFVVSAAAAGVVSAVVAAGDVVAAGGSVAVLSTGAALRVQLGIEPDQLAQLAEGQRVHLRAVNGGAAADGALVQLTRLIDANSHLAGGLVAVDAGATLLPGALVRATIVVRTLPAALVVPRQAVVRGHDPAGHDVVFVVAHATGDAIGDAIGNDIARAVAVDVVFIGDEAIVHGNIDVGDAVVTAGNATLADGAAVRRGAT